LYYQTKLLHQKNNTIMVRNFLNLATLAVMFCLFTSNLSAQYIVDAHSSRVKRYAESAAYNLMKQFNPSTGSDAYAVVESWYYYEDGDYYEIRVQNYWQGATSFWADKKSCNVDGIITVRRDGSKSNFKTTYKNAQIKDIEATRKQIMGAVIAIGVLSAVSDNN
jgi:hypothetical protein